MSSPTATQSPDVAYPDEPPGLERDLAIEGGALAQDQKLTLYRWMRLGRAADDRILELFRQGRMKGTVTGGQGNEGLSALLGLLLDKRLDAVTWTHRDLVGHLIWSGHLGDHLCQYIANSGSPTKAREGNAHHGAPLQRSYPMISHLGSMPPNVLGGVDSQRRKGLPAVGVALYGDGGSSTGDIHESMNLASLLDIPVLFVVINNRYAYSTPLEEQVAGSLVERAAGYGMKGRSIDVADVEANAPLLVELLEEARQTRRPAVLEARSLRLQGHAAYDTCDYIDPELRRQWTESDGLPNFRRRLAAEGLGEALDQIDQEMRDFVEATVQQALKLPPADDPAFHLDVLAPAPDPLPWKADEPADDAPATFAQALQRAHRKILAERPESLVMGQDIAGYGGAFKVTDGLFKEFGRSRVLNTPICESAMVGYATGLAVNGHRPIVEFQFADFATDATTQIVLNAATYHFRSGANAPLVLRLPCGDVGLGSFHSQDLEALYAHMPGLKILYPSAPQDAFNALLAAYEDDNPVLLFEHKRLYRQLKAPVRFDPDYRAVWRPALRGSGDYATVVAYGEALHRTSEALEYLKLEYDVACDLFDLRALAPLQLDDIRASLARTGRLVVVHEARRNNGLGAEIVSRLVEGHFYHLDAPPLRIASLDTPVPFADPLLKAFLPTKDRIAAALIDWIEAQG